MDFSNFSTEDLVKMLELHREELAQMVLVSGLEAKAETINAIEGVLEQRREENGETK